MPGGKLMQLELRFGSSTVMLADEFPDMSVLSPLSIGGTATVLHLSTDDVDAVWQRAIDGGAEVRQPLAEAFWGERYGQITDPFGHRWGSPSTYAMSRATSWSAPWHSCLANSTAGGSPEAALPVTRESLSQARPRPAPAGRARPAFPAPFPR